MTPVIRHLQSKFLNLSFVVEQPSLHWEFDSHIKTQGAEFYTQLVNMHPVLNLEYSILCNQIHDHLKTTKTITKKQLIDELRAGLMMADLLEHLHLHYLVVPREVIRLRKHQAVYRSLLKKLGGNSFSKPCLQPESIDIGLSFSQMIREDTGAINLFRLLAARLKRFSNLLQIVLGPGASTFANSFFAYLSWCFFIPRFLTNVLLLLKHTIPGPWMDEKERSLDWWTRFKAQFKRRWFELLNDIVWIVVGLLNCFLLVGPFAPVAVLLNLFAFAFDVANAAFRAHVELNRLSELKQFYNALYLNEQDPEQLKCIENYLKYVAKREQFENYRLGLSVVNTSVVFLLMSLTIPGLVLNPVILLVSAALLVAVWFAHVALTRKIESLRPPDSIEKPTKVSRLGFFAPKEKEAVEEQDDLSLERYNLA